MTAAGTTGAENSGTGTEPRVLVLAGGLSYERDVSLRSGRRVLDALRGAGVDAVIRDVDASLLPSFTTDPPDAVVIALHGAAGEDGSLQAVLDLCGIPYVGADGRAARLAWDKPTAKSVLGDAGIQTPDWVALPQERFTELGAAGLLDRVLGRFAPPVMVKPAQGGSGLGTSVVREASALATAMVGCFAYHPTALIEPYVTGMDVAVTIVDTGEGPVTLPAVRMVGGDGRHGYSEGIRGGDTSGP